MAVTVAKVMFLDRTGKAFVVDTDDVRYNKDSLRDRIDFEDDNDFDKEHNYYVKWRDCGSYCEEMHVHSSYYAARILCLAGDLASLEKKTFRFPTIAFDDRDLSPMASLSSNSSKLDQNDTEEEYPEYAENDEYEQYETDTSEENDLKGNKRARRLELEKAKADIRKQENLERVLRFQKKRVRGSLQLTQRASTSTAADNGPDGPPVHEDGGDPSTDAGQNPGSVEGPSSLNKETPEIVPMNDEDAPLEDNEVLAERPVVQIAGGNNNANQVAGRLYMDNPPPARVRKIRYNLVDGQYVINENLRIDMETYELMRMRPFKDVGLFIRDAIRLVWNDRELACRCLDQEKCQKAIPGLRVAEPEKIDLVTTIVLNWYVDEKGFTETEKLRDKIYAQVRSKLSKVIRDKKNDYFPNLIRRKRRREDDDEGAGDAPANAAQAAA